METNDNQHVNEGSGSDSSRSLGDLVIDESEPSSPETITSIDKAVVPMSDVWYKSLLQVQCNGSSVKHKKKFQLVNENWIPERLKNFTKTLKVDVTILNNASSIFERFRFIQKLGNGGQGTVYSAYCTMLKKPVALKITPKKETAIFLDLNSKKEIPYEHFINRLARVDNPGVIHSIGWIELENLYVQILEYSSDWIDVFHYVHENDCHLPEAEAIKIFSELVKILLKCHENNVAHLDIKEDNILLNRKTHEIKLIDFGCARPLQTKSRRFETLGAHIYCPPEFFADQGFEEGRMDVYMLGIFLYRMLYGQDPFTESDKLRNVLPVDIPPFPRRKIQDLLTTMLCYNEWDRPTLVELNAWCYEYYGLPDPRVKTNPAQYSYQGESSHNLSCSIERCDASIFQAEMAAPIDKQQVADSPESPPPDPRSGLLDYQIQESLNTFYPESATFQQGTIPSCSNEDILHTCATNDITLFQQPIGTSSPCSGQYRYIPLSLRRLKPFNKPGFKEHTAPITERLRPREYICYFKTRVQK